MKNYQKQKQKQDIIKTIKLQPFDLITKIQQAKPTHLSTLINKQLGYDVLIQQQIILMNNNNTIINNMMDYSGSIIGVNNNNNNNFNKGNLSTIVPSNFNNINHFGNSNNLQNGNIHHHMTNLNNGQNNHINATGLINNHNNKQKNQANILINLNHNQKQKEKDQSQKQIQIIQQKIKNCICSARPNSQTFKRLSKNLLNNVKNGVNQLILFTSHPSQTQSRLQSSIGTKANPGVFLISAISLLNQKYNNDKDISSFNYDIEISFSEMIDGQIYDLLNYTGQPLKINRFYNNFNVNGENKDDKNISNINTGNNKSNQENNQKQNQLQLHGQTYIKICTFKQFIKLFKTALFNNKERDFKTGINNNNYANNNANININKNQNQQQFQNDSQNKRSTFLMKIRSLIYDKNGNISHKQESIFIDFQNTQIKNVSSNANNGKNQISKKKKIEQKIQSVRVSTKKIIVSKNILPQGTQFSLSGMNALNLSIPEKNMNRQERDVNPSSSRNSIKNNVNNNSLGNKTIFDYILIDLNNSNPINKKMHYHLVQQNYLLYLIRQHLSYGQVTFISSMSSNPKKFNDNLNFINMIKDHSGLSSIVVPGSWQNKIQIKAFKRISIQWNYFQAISKIILSQIVQHHYSSIRELQNLKLGCLKVIKKFNYWVKNYKSLILKITTLKRNLKFIQNSNIADQISLIGSCVKSDHFKDFYNAKSYISLQREVMIKTQAIKIQIKECFNNYYKLMDSFEEIKRRENISAKNWIKILRGFDQKQGLLLVKEFDSNFNNSSLSSPNFTKTNFKNTNIYQSTKRLSLLQQQQQKQKQQQQQHQQQNQQQQQHQQQQTKNALFFHSIFDKTYKQKLINPNSNNNQNNTSLSINNYIYKLFLMSKQLLQYFHNFQNHLIDHDQRTIADEIIRQQTFLQQLQRINNFWVQFYRNLKDIGSNSNPISCQQQKIAINGNHFSLLKEMKKNNQFNGNFKSSLLDSAFWSKSKERQSSQMSVISKLGASGVGSFYFKDSDFTKSNFNNKQNEYNDESSKIKQQSARKKYLKLPMLSNSPNETTKTENKKLQLMQKSKQLDKKKQPRNIKQKSQKTIKLSSFKLSSMLLDPNSLNIFNNIKQNQNQEKEKEYRKGLKITKAQSLIS